MKELNSSYITEQNKLAAGGAWIWLLEITTTGYGTPIRLTNNNSDITWPSAGGNTYSKVPLTMDDVEASLDGKFPEFRLRIGELDISSTLRTRVRATTGLVGSIIRLRVVHSSHLDLTTPAIDESAEILSCELDLNAVTLTLGIPSLLSKRFPRDRYVPGFCRHKFAGALCQYAQPLLPFITSTSVVFTFWDGINRIYIGPDVNIVTEFFRYATPLGEAQGDNWRLSKDTGFTVVGSVYNDGFFLADNYYAVQPNLVYVKTEDDGGRAFVAETVLTGVSFRFGYDACDHTLTACQLRDNTQNYGGSPGIVGGVYG